MPFRDERFSSPNVTKRADGAYDALIFGIRELVAEFRKFGGKHNI
jgi:hypothetical protein